MKPGVYDISNAEYHASEGISRSGISELKKSPLHYWDRYLNADREQSEPSQAMILGSAIHTLVLEPDNFLNEFAVSSKVGRYWQAEDSEGKQIIRADDLEKAQLIANSILEHPKAQALLNGANIEKSIYWEDAGTGLLCKARPDIWNAAIGVVCEIKTTREANLNGFAYMVRTGDYHIQAAMQLDAIYFATGEKINSFVFIAAPTSRPFKPYACMLDEAAIEAGRREYKDALKVARKCIDSGKWDIDRDRIQVINFTEYQLASNPLFNLLEVYECQN